MTEFVKICAIIGLFTLYMIITGTPGVIVCHSCYKDEGIDKALWKGILLSYIVGVIISISLSAYMIY